MHYAGDVAEEGDIMQELEWVELVAKIVKPELTVLGQSLDIQTQVKIAYGYEIRAYRNEKEPETEAIEFATDFIVVEGIDGGWKPRVVVEAKVGSVTTHDAITYSQKAANHRSVFPYLRYGIMLGNRQHYPLPGRLYRHGTQFDFMISFRGYKPSAKELEAFRDVLIAEVKASQALENMIYESRRRDRDHHTLLHRRLTLGDIDT
jgi:hypothetical protein